MKGCASSRILLPCVCPYYTGRRTNMQYHLDTIPVWEAMEKNTACPLCALYRRVEDMEIERSLGGPASWSRTRASASMSGASAPTTTSGSVAMQNRLGHALLADSHTKELLKKLEALQKRAGETKRGLFGGRDAVRGAGKGTGGAEPLLCHLRRTYATTWSAISIPSCTCGKPTRAFAKNGRLHGASASRMPRTCSPGRRSTSAPQAVRSSRKAFCRL